jgi:hypothetical protein
MQNSVFHNSLTHRGLAELNPSTRPSARTSATTRVTFCGVSPSRAGFLCALFLSLFALQLSAANRYVRQGATGNGSGADWANAYTSLPATLTRGDTYYIADGSYPGYTFDDSGSTLITIKKAIENDHGTATGWVAGYGDGQAVFANIVIAASYLRFDGQSGGGPASWQTGLGLAVRNPAGHLVLFSGGPWSHIEFDHVELDGQSTGPQNQEAVYGTSGASDVSFRYCYIHHIGEDIFQMRGNWTNLLVEYSLFAYNYKSSAYHGDVFEYGAGTAAGWIHRYNWFDHTEVTYVWGSHDNGTLSGAQIYGNVITNINASNGVVSGLSGDSYRGTVTGLRFYNNTIANAVNQSGFANLRGVDNQIANNIWYNCSSLAWSTGTHDYNWFHSSGAQSEAHIQNGTGNPFVDLASGDVRLAAPTSPGMTLAICTTDMTSKPRGADGVWDRGAHEYGGTTTTPPPTNAGTLTAIVR